MACDSITFYRTFLAIAGILPPKQWHNSWKVRAFQIYGIILDIHMTSFALLALAYTFEHLNHYQSILAFFDGQYESMMLNFFALERLLIRWNSKQFGKTLSMFDEFQTSGEHNLQIVKSYKKTADSVFRYFCGLALAAYFQFIVNYLVNYCTTSEAQHDQYSCKRFLIEVWMPFDHGDPYSLQFAFNILQVSMSVLTFFISSVTVPLLTTHISGQFRVIANIFENHLSVHNYVHFKRDDDEKEDLLNTIRHHQFMLEVVQELNVTLHLVLLLKLLFSSLPIVFVALTLSQVPFGTVLFIRFLFHFVLLFTVLLILCFFGEQLTQEALQVYRAVYMNQWYRMSKKDQKLLLFVARRAQRPVRLEVWPRFKPICLETFLSVMRFSYSAYSVIVVNTSRKNHQ